MAQPLRANVPVDDDFSSALPPTNTEPEEKISKEQQKLAQIGNSPQWDVIQDYLDARIQVYKNGLFGEDLSGKDSAVIGQRFLAAQAVINEFESLKAEVNRTTEAVNEATKE